MSRKLRKFGMSRREYHKILVEEQEWYKLGKHYKHKIKPIFKKEG